MSNHPAIASYAFTTPLHLRLRQKIGLMMLVLPAGLPGEREVRLCMASVGRLHEAAPDYLGRGYKVVWNEGE